MTDNIKNKENSLTLKDFMQIAMNKWYILGIGCVVCILISLIITLCFVTPVYKSTAKLYIKDKNSQIVNTNEIAVSTYLTRDYEEIVVDRSILEEVIETLSLDTSYSALANCITTENPEDTRFIEISVTYPDAELSKEIADCICEVTQRKIVDVMDIDRVIIFSEGNLPSGPASPDIFLNIIKGIAVGLILFFIYVIIIYFRDDKINTEEDVEKHLGLTVLGNIPYFSKENTTKRK